MDHQDFASRGFYNAQRLTSLQFMHVKKVSEFELKHEKQSLQLQNRKHMNTLAIRLKYFYISVSLIAGVSVELHQLTVTLACYQEKHRANLLTTVVRLNRSCIKTEVHIISCTKKHHNK